MPVRVKNYICSPDGKSYTFKNGDVRLALAVNAQTYCPAACPFCIAKGTKERRRTDPLRFERVLRMLWEQRLIKNIKITGGEPFWDIGLFNELVNIIFDVCGQGFELSVSTNGIHLGQMHRLEKLSWIDTLHISRHHYDDAVNRFLFGGADVPGEAQLREIFGTVAYKDIFVLNCMLLRDYINSPAEAHRFMDFAIGIGASKVGFMCCTKINRFAEEQAIRFEDVIRDGDPSLLFTRGFYDFGVCHCRDGIYASEKGGMIEFYGRDTRNNETGYCRGLVYDADNTLRDGYGGKVLWDGNILSDGGVL